MRSARSVAFVVVALLTATALITSARALAAQPSPTSPAELFDLGLAERRLNELNGEISRLQNELADVLEEVDGLTIERDFIDLNQQARNEVMQDSRTRARNMAINAYVGIGPPLSGVVILDAQTANDLSYRHGLLRQQAERLQESAETYALLAGEADSNVLALSNGINDRIREAEALNRQIRRLSELVPESEWHVQIAAIHALANDEFNNFGRPEPSPEAWRQLRFCESTERYDVDTGNSFYGAYQFTQETWYTVGGDGNPAEAPPAEQDARARLLYAQRGAQPWPICGRYLPN